MDLGMFAKKIQVSGILSKYDVSIKEGKIIGAVIEELEQQCKKQKEAIDKIQMIITDMQLELIGIKPYHSYVVDGNIIRNMAKNIEDIIKEVSE